MPRSPRCGLLPRLRYSYDEGNHKVACACGAHVASSEPLVVRRFVQSHVGEHARGRIVNPEPDPET